MKKLNIGVLGLHRGAVAAEIAAQFADRVKIAAVCDINGELAEKTAAKLGAETAYTDYVAMLNDRSLDAVYVATPVPNHAEHCTMAFRAGKHVLSEVTALSDLRDAEMLLNVQ